VIAADTKNVRDEFAAACIGKVVFDTFRLAQKSLRFNEKGRRVYHCGYCGKFHVGSTIVRGRRRGDA
jgi:hypothetical protein